MDIVRYMRIYLVPEKKSHYRGYRLKGYRLKEVLLYEVLVVMCDGVR